MKNIIRLTLISCSILLLRSYSFSQLNLSEVKEILAKESQSEESNDQDIVIENQDNRSLFSFSDIQKSEYKENIIALAKRGVIKGYPDGSFGPLRGVTRAEILKIILEGYLGDELGNETNCFDDVQNQWYAKYVCYASKNKIVRGYPDGTFKPDQGVTTAEALKIALETFKNTRDKLKEGTGNDRYQPYFEFVHNNSLFSKYALLPNKAMSRGEISFLVHQLLIENESTISFNGKRSSGSAGCGTNPPSTPPQQSLIDGLQRNYITAVGNKYDKNTPSKLIFAFHGRTNSNKQVRGYYKVEEASKGDGIFIYPLGLPEGGPSRSWRGSSEQSDQLRDFALFDQLVEEFSEKYCINKDEIYVVGHSLGAWFTNSLACARGNIIRATGSVGGSTTSNECSGPTASLIMHNPEDRLASFAGGIAARDQRLVQNGCSETTKEVGPKDGNCVQYSCQDDADVVWCPHSDSTAYNGNYYPHTWPNFAGKYIWEFFEKHSG